MNRIATTIAAGIFALAAMASPVQAEHVTTIGVDPVVYAIITTGVEGWNDAGAGFVVQATGCGTGDITFCFTDDPWAFGLGVAQIAWFPIGGNVIWINAVSAYPFTASTACHEIGHWLGLHYHRDDPASCMKDPGSTSNVPDAIDLQRLAAIEAGS